MRVLVVYAHPVETSYAAALRDAALATLRAGGHDIDLLDLHAEGFDPVLSRAERLAYHTIPDNITPVADHVARLQRAEALVLVYPVWNFGFPAILKGWLDRVFLPEVSFRIRDGRVLGALDNIRHLVAVTTYGADRFRAFLIGDPPKKVITRMLRHTMPRGGRVRYLAHYDMNRSTDATRTAFLARVRDALGRL